MTVHATAATTEELISRVKAKALSEGWAATRAMHSFGKWLNWCEERDERPLPVRAEALTRFLLHGAASGVPVAQLRDLAENIGFCHGKSGLSHRLEIENAAWRAFCGAMLASAGGAYVTPPPDAELAKRALTRLDDAPRNP